MGDPTMMGSTSATSATLVVSAASAASSHLGRPRTAEIDLATWRKAFVSPIQLAAYVGVTRRTIYHHIEKGALAARRIGGVVRIRTAEARRYAGVEATR